MARAAWAVVAVGALVISYVACQNTWRGLKQDARENAALARQKAQDANLDETARAVGEHARAAAERAGEGLKKMADNLRPRDEAGAKKEAAPTAAATATSGTRSAAAREVDEAIGKAAAKARESGDEIAHEVKGAAVHVEVARALAADTTIDASHVHVEADEAARTVVLRGSVPDAHQRAAAERIAAAHAAGYQVRNELAAIPAP
jgi:hypothetical protein